MNQNTQNIICAQEVITGQFPVQYPRHNELVFKILSKNYINKGRRVKLLYLELYVDYLIFHKSEHGCGLTTRGCLLIKTDSCSRLSKLFLPQSSFSLQSSHGQQMNTTHSETSLAERILPDVPEASEKISSSIASQYKVQADPFRYVLSTIKNSLYLVMLTHHHILNNQLCSCHTIHCI